MAQASQSAGALLIVGAGPGISQATAERFGRAGWRVILSSRSSKNLDLLVSRLIAQGINAHGLVMDATDAAAVASTMRNADHISSGLTTVLYNAASVRRQDLFTMSDAEVESDIAVNITGGFHTIRAATQLFNGRGGSILVTGGGLATNPHAAYASLGAGKAALRNLVEGLAPGLADRKIKIAIATVNTFVKPDSYKTKEVAEVFWTLATDPASGWEIVYPTT